MISKLKNKSHGFTLIEVLAVVVILSIVSFVGFNVFNSLINKTDSTTKHISFNNIRSAAEVYSREALDSDWESFVSNSSNYKYTCVTVKDLINTGFFDEDFLGKKIYSDDNSISENSYVKVVKDISNMTVVSTEIVNDDKDSCLNSARESVVNDVNTFVITYHSNGGSECGNSIVEVGEKVNLTVPIRHGYIFNGWFTTSVGGVRVGESENYLLFTQNNSSTQA